MTCHEVHDNVLRITLSDGAVRQIAFNWPIAQILEFPDVILVRTEPKQGACDNQNIYGVSALGSILWRVRARRHVYPDSPYTGMINEGEGAKLMNWDGLNVWIDPNSGKELKTQYGK